MAKYYSDGWMIKRNPSPIGGGFTVVREHDRKLLIRFKILKPGLTNNEAEVRGIRFAMRIAKEGDTISSDSKFCIQWVKWGMSKKRKDLVPLLKDTKKMMIDKNINLIWERRDKNLAGIYNEFKTL